MALVNKHEVKIRGTAGGASYNYAFETAAIAESDENNEKIGQFAIATGALLDNNTSKNPYVIDTREVEL